MSAPIYPNPISLRDVASEFAFNIDLDRAFLGSSLANVSGNTWSMLRDYSAGYGDLTGKFLRFLPAIYGLSGETTHTYKITKYELRPAGYGPGSDYIEFVVDDGWTPSGDASFGTLLTAAMNNFYRTAGSAYVPADAVGFPKSQFGGPARTPIPQSGPLSLADFYGTYNEVVKAFTSSQTWTVPWTGWYEYIIIGGGGGGGTSVYSNYLEGGGGGGAGGVVYGSTKLTKGEVITVVIGGGGGNTSYRTAYDYYGNPYTVLTNGGSNGVDTTLTKGSGEVIRAYGGGGGGGYNGQSGLNGGSGGGAMPAYGQGSAGGVLGFQGNNGGAGLEDHYSGGGGGFGSAATQNGGGGALWTRYTQDPYSTNVVFGGAAGGGGGYYGGRAYPAAGGSGGRYGDTPSGKYPDTTYDYGRSAAFYVDSGRNGQPNTGGGGGGGAYYGGGQGGSGYVLLYWALDFTSTVTKRY